MSERAENVGLPFSIAQHCAVRNGEIETAPSRCAASAEIDGSWPTTSKLFYWHTHLEEDHLFRCLNLLKGVDSCQFRLGDCIHFFRRDRVTKWDRRDGGRNYGSATMQRAGHEGG